MKKWIFILMLTSFWACSTEETVEPQPEHFSEQTFQLHVPPDFSWSSVVQDVVLVNFVTDSVKTYALDGTPVELYNQDDELLDALMIYHGTVCFNIRVPAETATLKIKLPAINAEMEFSSNKRSLKFEIPEISSDRIHQMDCDNDGLCDKYDVAPHDPNITFRIGKSGKRTSWNSYFIFEDLWPSKGDFDFNDFIVKTNFSFTRGKNNFISEITGIYSAEWNNPEFGLGFELFEARGAYLIYLDDVLEEVTGADLEKSMYNGINVLNEATKNGNVNKRFSIKLKEGSITDFVMVPFLYRLDEKDHQIRPFGTPPTQQQKMALFSSGDDASPRTWNWTKGKKFKYPLEGKNAFYRSTESYPWCVQFMAKSFTKPAEMQNIVESYPKFEDWVQSGGTVNNDWYNYPAGK